MGSVANGNARMHPSFKPREFDYDSQLRQVGYDTDLVCLEVSPESAIRRASSTLTAALGFRPEEIVGTSALDLFPVSEEDTIRQLLQGDGAEPLRLAHSVVLAKDGRPLSALVGRVATVGGAGHVATLIVALPRELSAGELAATRGATGSIGAYYDQKDYSVDANIHLGIYEHAEEDFRVAAHRLLTEFLDNMGSLRGKKILELGCGIGNAALRMVEDYGAGAVAAITISNEQLRLCQHAATRSPNGGKVSFRLMDAHELEFAPQSFDAVIAMESIFHMDRDKVLGEVTRVLRPGGQFAFCDAYPEDGGILHTKAGEHMLINVNQTLALLRKHGFVNIRLTDWTERVRPSYRILYCQAASVVRLALKRNLSSDQTLELARRILGREPSAEDRGVILQELLAQQRGETSTESRLGYCYIQAIRP